MDKLTIFGISVVAAVSILLAMTILQDHNSTTVIVLPDCNNDEKPPMPDVEGIVWNLDECYYFLDDPSIPYNSEIYFLEQWREQPCSSYEGIPKYKELTPKTSAYEMRYAECNELRTLENMSCPEIVDRNTTGGRYESKDNREFARDKVLACSDIEENLVYHGSCDDISDRSYSGEPYLFEDHKMQAENHLIDCYMISFAQKDLQQILKQCDRSYPEKPMYYVQFDNGTHFINNTRCEWKTRDLPVYPGMGFFEDNLKDD